MLATEIKCNIIVEMVGHKNTNVRIIYCTTKKKYNCNAFTENAKISQLKTIRKRSVHAKC